MTLRRLMPFLASLAMCFATFTPNLFAQGSDLGTIRGNVTDSSGALIPNAQVLITDTGNLRVYTYKTDARGSYLASALVPGHYKATITAPGFNTSVVEGIVLSGSDVVQSNAILHPSATESVQVTAEGGQINTENSTISETLSPAAVIDLPRDSRDIYQFLYINPNVTQGAEPGTFKFVGTQSYGASYSVDGQRSSGGIFGSYTQSQPSLESVGEVNVLTNAFSAEYAGVANVRINTKSGGSQNHGSVFYNNLNSALATWTMSDKQNQAAFVPDPPFENTYPRSRFNDTSTGASWGGPVPKLKNTFFFMAYEFQSSISPSLLSDLSSGNGNGVLGPQEQSGNFSQMNTGNLPLVPANLIGIIPAADTVTAADGTQRILQIPSNLINPITAKLVSLYFPHLGASVPVDPTTGTIPNYSTSVQGTNTQHMGDLRIDHNFNESNRIYGVYHGSAQNNASSPVAGAYSGLGLLQNVRMNSTVSLSYTHVFSPFIVNEARGGYNTQNYYTKANTTVTSFLQSIGFSSADIASYGSIVGAPQMLLHGNPVISWGGGIESFTDGGRSADRNQNQGLDTFGDTLTWSLGTHTIKVGADFVRNQAIDGFAASRGAPVGDLAYTGGLSGYAQFLLGMAPHTVSYNQAPRPAMNTQNWENGYYVQDDWRVNSRLTLNLGMRYDLYTPYTEKNNILANFDPNFVDSSTGRRGRFIIPSTNALNYLPSTVTDASSPGYIGYALAADSGLGVGRGLVKPDKQDLGPRIGAAYRIGDKSVVRGGIGIYYPTSSAHIIRDPLATNPFSARVTEKSIGANQISSWPVGGETTGIAPITGGIAPPFTGYPSANYVPTDIKNPRLFEWNATFERQLPKNTTVRASYIGGEQQGQIVGVDINEIAPNNIGFDTTQGDNGVTPATPYLACDPFVAEDCNQSIADTARYFVPTLGDYVIGFGNRGRSVTNSFQAQAQSQGHGFMYSLGYTLLSQNSDGLDVGNDSLAGDTYNPFTPRVDYGRDSYVSKHRVVAYAMYELPFGKGKQFAANASRLTDALIGGWQATTNLFAKTGTGYTPNWECNDCDPIMPGNVASGAVDAVGDFDTPSLRPRLIADPYKGHPKGFQFNPAAFTVPASDATLYSDPNAVKRNFLTGPGTYGINLGIHKNIRVNDRIAVKLGADIDNVLNHPLLAPDQSNGGGGSPFSSVGSFNVQVNQPDGTPQPVGVQPGISPIDPNPNDPAYANSPVGQPTQLNSNFGQLNQSFSQEGVNANRQIRLLARITF
jgi:hypothetical protein